MGLQGLRRLESAQQMRGLKPLVFGTGEALTWRDRGLENSKCLAVLGLPGPLIIPQVCAGQLTDAGKWCHAPDTCCLDFVTLIMENFKSRRHSLITS